MCNGGLGIGVIGERKLLRYRENRERIHLGFLAPKIKNVLRAMVNCFIRM